MVRSLVRAPKADGQARPAGAAQGQRAVRLRLQAPGPRLAAAAAAEWARRGYKTVVSAIVAVVVMATAVWGLGTVLGTLRPSAWPQSVVAGEIRRDSVGWSALNSFLDPEDIVFALDYSIASQIWYYTGRPAYTSWGQYRIWGVPDLADATIVSLDYLPEIFVSTRLRDAFQHVEGPQRFHFAERRATKEVRIWQAEGLQWEHEVFLKRFDFLTLLEAQ